MFKSLCQRAMGLASAFLSVQRGSILIYTGAFMSIGVGSAALSIDIGRMVLLTTQMQNRADAGALAGAAQLDAGANAMWRAEIVVRDSMKAFTTAIAIEGSELAVLTVAVHPAMDDAISMDTVTPATDDTARFVVVTMARRTLSFFYAPAASMLTGKSGSNITELNASAIAMSDPYVCQAQPMMICNPFEIEDPVGSGNWVIPSGADLFDKANIGKTIVLKPEPNSGGATAGNFGFLQLPYDGTASVAGAKKIKEALAAERPWGCYGVASLTTATGSMVGPVSDGINTRFGDSANSFPAPNITEYPIDQTFLLPDKLGNGDWDWAGYWLANHGAAVVQPAILQGEPRYRTYLFEQGVNFFIRNGGKQASVTAFQDGGGGWTEINPTDAIYGAADTIPIAPDPDAVSGPISTLGQARRLMSLAVLACGAAGVGGKSTVTSPGRYISIFLTERARAPGAGGGIYGEIVAELQPQISLEFHGNVRLVE